MDYPLSPASPVPCTHEDEQPSTPPPPTQNEDEQPSTPPPPTQNEDKQHESPAQQRQVPIYPPEDEEQEQEQPDIEPTLVRRKLVLFASDEGILFPPAQLRGKRLHGAINPVIKCEKGMNQLAYVVTNKRNRCLTWASTTFFLRAVFNSIADMFEGLDVFEEELEARQSKAPRTKDAASKRIAQVTAFLRHVDDADDGHVLIAFVDLFIAISVYLADI